VLRSGEGGRQGLRKDEPILFGDVEPEGRPDTLPANRLNRLAGVAPGGRHSLRRVEAQRDHGACRARDLVARAAPLLRLAANGERWPPHRGTSGTDGRCRDVVALHSRLGWPADAARLEGGCHAGRNVCLVRRRMFADIASDNIPERRLVPMSVSVRILQLLQEWADATQAGDHPRALAAAHEALADPDSRAIPGLSMSFSTWKRHRWTPATRTWRLSGYASRRRQRNRRCAASVGAAAKTRSGSSREEMGESAATASWNMGPCYRVKPVRMLPSRWRHRPGTRAAVHSVRRPT
jgi:hypothetical protein